MLLKPGIYFNLPNEEYHADPAISCSGIKRLLQNPQEYWWYSHMNPERESLDKKALKIGRAFHTLLLEPKKFGQEFTIKAGCKSSSLENTIGEGEYSVMRKALDSLMLEPLHAQLFRDGIAEVSMVWRDEETGVMCRCRHDYLKLGMSVDYKSAADVSDYKLGYTIADNGYDVQAAFYLEGMNQIKKLLRTSSAGLIWGAVDMRWLEQWASKDHDIFVFLFQRKTVPYITRAQVITPPVIELGREKYRQALGVYREHVDRYGVNKWPSGYEGIEDILIDNLPNRIYY